MRIIVSKSLEKIKSQYSCITYYVIKKTNLDLYNSLVDCSQVAPDPSFHGCGQHVLLLKLVSEHGVGHKANI